MKSRVLLFVAALVFSTIGHAEIHVYGTGFTAPNVFGASNVYNPQVGDLVYDQSAGNFYGYTQYGSWESLGSPMPSGVITAYAGTSAPSGWLMCDGSAVSRTTYAALFAAIGTAYGHGDGSTTFNLPDLRGQFLRGTDNMGTSAGAAGRDPGASSRTAMNTGGNTGNNVGSIQSDQMQGHVHQEAANTLLGQVSSSGFNSGLTAGGTSYSKVGQVNDSTGVSTYTGVPSSDGTNGTPRTGTETRPINAYVNFLIKL